MGGGSLVSMLLQTPIAIQNPNLVPLLASEIMQMPHLAEMLHKNPIGFQQQIKNQDFLQLLVGQIRNRENPTGETHGFE